MSKKILITGGTGFIGGYVYRHFRHIGYEVYNYDINGDYSDDGLIHGSILDYNAVKEAAELADVIFHFAGFSNINHVKAYPRECIELNIMGTTNFLEALRVKGQGKFIFASSVYANSSYGHFYTTSKFASELICENYTKLYGIPTAILRIGTVYGERSRYEDVVSIFVKKAIKGEQITIHGSGDQVRHFIHGEDVAEACKRIVERDLYGKTFVLAASKGTSIRELAETVKDVFPYVKIITQEGLSREDDYQGAIDIAALQDTYNSLNWKPDISIHEGIKRLGQFLSKKEG